MPKISSLLGDKVIRNNGEEVSTESLIDTGKVVGLYFSAHWCPPCRAITPENVPTPYFYIFYFFFFETTNMRCFCVMPEYCWPLGRSLKMENAKNWFLFTRLFNILLSRTA